MRRSATKRWASRRTTIPTRSCRSATRWGGSDRLAVGRCPKSSISTAGASPIPESDQSGFREDRETVSTDLSSFANPAITQIRLKFLALVPQPAGVGDLRRLAAEEHRGEVGDP